MCFLCHIKRSPSLLFKGAFDSGLRSLLTLLNILKNTFDSYLFEYLEEREVLLSILLTLAEYLTESSFLYHLIQLLESLKSSETLRPF